MRTAFALVWSLTVALAVVDLSKKMSTLYRAVFLLWLLIFSYYNSLEAYAYLVVAGFCVNSIYGKIRTKELYLLLMLVVMSFVKFNLAVSVFCVLVVVALVLLVEKRYVDFAKIFAAGGFFYCGVWVLLGQELANLPLWVRGGFEISLGYNSAMSLLNSMGVFIPAICSLLIMVAALLVLLKHNYGNCKNTGIIFAFIVLLYFKWKHGLVRSGEVPGAGLPTQVMVYLWYYPLSFSLLFFDELKIKFTKARNTVNCLYALGVLMCLIGIGYESGSHYSDGKQIFYQRISSYIPRVADAVAVSARIVTGRYAELYESHKSRKEAVDYYLPNTKKIIGDSSVDVANCLQLVALDHDLNYQPRPVFQGYSAYTKYLRSLNRTHVAGDDGPEYFLMLHETIDHRFPTLDDSQTLVQILGSYVPVAAEGDFLLMRRRGAHPATSYVQFSEHRIAWEQTLRLPAASRGPIFMAVEIKSSLFGKFISQALSQLPMLMLVKTTENSYVYRISPGLVDEPFILSPLLENNRDIVSLINGKLGQMVTHVQFVRPWYLGGQLKDEIVVRLYAKPEFLDSK
jgi:hypothetical protein